jgi:hypothetical protein
VGDPDAVAGTERAPLSRRCVHLAPIARAQPLDREAATARSDLGASARDDIFLHPPPSHSDGGSSGYQRPPGDDARSTQSTAGKSTSKTQRKPNPLTRTRRSRRARCTGSPEEGSSEDGSSGITISDLLGSLRLWRSTSCVKRLRDGWHRHSPKPVGALRARQYSRFVRNGFGGLGSPRQEEAEIGVSRLAAGVL